MTRQDQGLPQRQRTCTPPSASLSQESQVTFIHSFIPQMFPEELLSLALCLMSKLPG